MSDFKFDPIKNVHHKHFKKYTPASQGQIGHNISKWVASVINNPSAFLKGISQVSRDDIVGMVKNTKVSDRDLTVCIMAWGGQRRDHGRLLFNDFDKVEKIIHKLRRGGCVYDAYDSFLSLWVNKQMKGMGIAYFTKIIFFLSENNDAFIMDQWTAKSFNLLMNKKIVDINKAGCVTAKNRSDTYKEFNDYIGFLSRKLNVSKEDVELKMFSEGYGRGLWRNHLKENYV